MINQHGLRLGSLALALLTAGLLTGCGSQDPPSSDNLPSFVSMDEAYAAVDEILTCESDPVGEPIVPMAGGRLTSDQKLCAENVQIDLYPDEEALQGSYELWNGSQQGAVHLVRGANWMVVDVTVAAAGEATPWDLEGLAEELNGEYTQAGG